MPDTKTILKYLKVRALAERGDPGERDNAQRILNKLREDNPGIDSAAEQYKRKNENEEQTYSEVWPGNGQRSGNWEEIFNFAKGVVNQAYDFAQTAANAYAGKLLAEEYVETSTRSTRSGNVLISLKMSLPVYNQARRLNYAQREAFRRVMHEMLEEELDLMLGED